MKDEKVVNMNLWQKLNAVKKQIVYIQKDTRVKFGNTSYSAVTHDAVTNATRGALIDLGVLVKTDLLSYEVTQYESKKFGKVAQHNRFIGNYNVQFINVDKPEERESVKIVALHDDGGDKSPGSAESYALKRVLLKMLGIPTGENDEARHIVDDHEKQVKSKDAKESVGPKLSDAEIDNYRVSLVDAGIDPDRVFKRICVVLGFSTMKDIPETKRWNVGALIDRAVAAVSEKKEK